MKKIFFLLLIPLLMIFSIEVNAKCAASGSVTTTITSTANTCGRNGTITATFSTASNITIQLIKGGSILQSVVNPTSPYTFTNLQPGTDYEVKTVSSNDNSIVYSANPNITVADNYIPITDATITISDVCTNFTTGGTFTVNSVTGGTAPYQYSVILSNDPAYPDASSVYTASNTANVTAFGTYQIRVKDACGNYKTFTKTISANIPAIKFYWTPKKVCNSNQAQGTFWYGNAGASPIVPADFLPEGIKLVIRDKDSSGAILFDGTYTGTPFTYTESPTHTYYVTSTNSCGLTTSYEHALTNFSDQGEGEAINAYASSSGCGAAESMIISASSFSLPYWNYPIQVTVKNSAGTVVYTKANFNEYSEWKTGSLPMGNYTVTYVDACGDSKTETVNNPQSAGTPALSFYQYTNYRCSAGPLTQNGTTQLAVQITGYLPNRNNAIVTITSGPSNVGVNGMLVENKYWGWTNIIPGTYTFSYTTCGVTNTGTVTVTSGSHLLNQSLSSTATSFCSKGGTITSNKVYNGGYGTTVELLNSSNTVIANNSTGTFNNVPAGTYSTRMKVTTCNGAFYYVDGSSVTITNSSTGPQISSSTGVVCEDAAGNPLSTGSAYLTIAGVAPYTIQYRVQGSGSAYTTINTSNSKLQIDNLTANSIYEVILTDACGSSFSTTIQIKTMGNLVASNTSQPCVGSAYSLAIPNYAGATYQWTDSLGNVLSNTRSYTFASYIAANDGTYTCKITWSTCVTSFVNVKLNSSLCGSPIDDVCYKPAVTTGTALETKHGITALGRAGADNGNWPMVRKGAWTALEAKTKGFVVNRLTDAQIAAIPSANLVEGMMVYNITQDCLQINVDGTATGWKCFNTQTCP